MISPLDKDGRLLIQNLEEHRPRDLRGRRRPLALIFQQTLKPKAWMSEIRRTEILAETERHSERPTIEKRTG